MEHKIKIPWQALLSLIAIWGLIVACAGEGEPVTDYISTEPAPTEPNASVMQLSSSEDPNAPETLDTIKVTELDLGNNFEFQPAPGVIEVPEDSAVLMTTAGVSIAIDGPLPFGDVVAVGIGIYYTCWVISNNPSLVNEVVSTLEAGTYYTYQNVSSWVTAMQTMESPSESIVLPSFAAAVEEGELPNTTEIGGATLGLYQLESGECGTWIKLPDGRKFAALFTPLKPCDETNPEDAESFVKQISDALKVTEEAVRAAFTALLG